MMMYYKAMQLNVKNLTSFELIEKFSFFLVFFLEIFLSFIEQRRCEGKMWVIIAINESLLKTFYLLL